MLQVQSKLKKIVITGQMQR